MLFSVNDEPFEFRPTAVPRSQLLVECMAAAGADADTRPQALPATLERRWLEAWDQEADLAELTLEDRLGVFKVRPRDPPADKA